MKKIALITFCVFSGLTSNAQQKFIGVKGAFALTNFAWKQVLPDSKFSSNFSTGVSFDYLIKNKIRFGGDLLLEQRGFSDEINLTDSNGNSIDKAQYSIKYSFITIPIKLGYTIGNNFYGFGNLGIIPAVLLQAKSNYDNNIIPFQSNQTEKNPKIDLAGMAELGAGYKTKTRLNFYAALRFQRSFTNALKEPYANGHSIKHYGMSIFAGLGYQL